MTEVAVGDRVAIPWLGYACGTCEYCVSGWETLCLEQKNIGYSIDGSFADYVEGVRPVRGQGAGRRRSGRRRAAHLRRRDDVQGGQGRGHEVVGSRRGLRRRRPRPSGASSTRAIAGGRVVAVDVVDEKLELARELGAEFTVNAAEQDPAEFIQELGGADQAIALAVSPASFEQAYRSLRRGGTLVFVALPAENHIELPIFETVLNGITVVGSIVGTRVDLREVFELHAPGQTRVIRETRSFGEVNEAIADVEAGRVPARIVFTP